MTSVFLLIARAVAKLAIATRFGWGRTFSAGAQLKRSRLRAHRRQSVRAIH
jgi:hypothetical protein